MMKKFNSSALAGFIIAGSLLASLVGCMKEPELKEDFGPEFTGQDYSKAIFSLELPDPYSIKKGEYAYFTRQTFLEGRDYSLDLRWAYTVTDKQEDDKNWIFTFVHKLHEYEGGQEKVSTNTSNVTLEKKVVAPTVNMSSYNNFRAEHVRATTKIQAQAAEDKTTFHNLKVVSGFYKTPEFVQQRPDCGGKTPETCKDPIKVNVLSYDMVNWDQDQKYHVEWVVSPDIPYFGSAQLNLNDPRYSIPGVLRSCTSTNMPMQGQRVRVTQCDELKDFTFGHN